MKPHILNLLSFPVNQECLSSAKGIAYCVFPFTLGDSTRRPGNIQKEFVEPPQNITPEALLNTNIWCSWDGVFLRATVKSSRADSRKFLIQWHESPQSTSVVQLLPIGDPSAVKFQISRADFGRIFEAINEEEDDRLPRSVRSETSRPIMICHLLPESGPDLPETNQRRKIIIQKNSSRRSSEGTRTI